MDPIQANKLAEIIATQIALYADERLEQNVPEEDVRKEVSWAVEFINVHQEDLIG